MRRGLDWRGVAAAILSVGVIAVVVLGEVFAFRNPDRLVSTEEVATVSTVLGAAIGAVAGYLAGYRGPRNGPPAPPGAADGGAGEPPGISGPGGGSGAVTGCTTRRAA
jgi:hypothetical protein